MPIGPAVGGRGPSLRGLFALGSTFTNVGGAGGLNPFFGLTAGEMARNDANAFAGVLVSARERIESDLATGRRNPILEARIGSSSGPTVRDTILRRRSMPNLPLSMGFTAPAGQIGTFGGFGGIAQPGFLGGVANIISALNPPDVQVVNQGTVGPPLAVDPGTGMAVGAACPTRPRLPTAFVADDPCGGSPRVYRNMGAVSSALMPGDFRAHRRVNKLASKARRPRARTRKR